MPKRLSDITHAYERSAADLEAAQDELTGLVEAARARVEGASKAHRTVSGELAAYLQAHPDEVIVSNDYGYHFDPHCPGSIRRRSVHWSHHVWVEDPPEFQDTYRVPPATDQAALTAMAAVWDDTEPNGEAIMAKAWTMGEQEVEETTS